MTREKAWRQLLYPHKPGPQEEVKWSVTRLNATDDLLETALKKLEKQGAIYTQLGPTNLNRLLEQTGIWERQERIRVHDLWEYHCRFLYWPRLQSFDVLKGAIERAVSELVAGPFAFAECYDEDTGKYEGLVISGNQGALPITPQSVIVRPDVAQEAAKEAIEAANVDVMATPNPPGPTAAGEPVKTPGADTAPVKLTRFFGAVELDQERVAKHFGQVMEGIIEPLQMLANAKVKVRVEIEAEAPDGIDENLKRTLLENANTLKFKTKDLE